MGKPRAFAVPVPIVAEPLPTLAELREMADEAEQENYDAIVEELASAEAWLEDRRREEMGMTFERVRA